MVIDQALIVEGLLNPKSLLHTREWRPLTEGVFISTIYETGNHGSRAAFLRYLPGAAVPNHQHTGFEHILILDGWQMDGATLYEVGSLIIHPPGTEHDLVAPEGCIALGIWEKPVSFVTA